MTTGVKLAIGGMVIAAVTGYMAYQGAMASWQYYLTVDECLSSSATLGDSRLRVHGLVAGESLQVAPDRSEARFRLQGEAGELSVICKGPLPDNLKEQVEVVVEGRLKDANTLSGDRVLTQCASKYRSEGSSDKPAKSAAAETGGGI